MMDNIEMEVLDSRSNSNHINYSQHYSQNDDPLNQVLQ